MILLAMTVRIEKINMKIGKLPGQKKMRTEHIIYDQINALLKATHCQGIINLYVPDSGEGFKLEISAFKEEENVDAPSME